MAVGPRQSWDNAQWAEDTVSACRGRRQCGLREPKCSNLQYSGTHQQLPHQKRLPPPLTLHSFVTSLITSQRTKYRRGASSTRAMADLCVWTFAADGKATSVPPEHVGRFKSGKSAMDGEMVRAL